VKGRIDLIICEKDKIKMKMFRGKKHSPTNIDSVIYQQLRISKSNLSSSK
jgi:hypothetical protein